MSCYGERPRINRGCTNEALGDLGPIGPRSLRFMTSEKSFKNDITKH